MNGYFPPPWEMNEENRERTEGWLAFQKEAICSKCFMHAPADGSGWIDRQDFPSCDKILCFDKGRIFICELVKAHFGHYYVSNDWDHVEHGEGDKEWTHWMPLPEPPTDVRKDGVVCTKASN